MGERILFLRQVDDFAVASKHQQMAETLLEEINKQLRIPLKTLGIVTCFNGLDVNQTIYM